MNQAMKKLEEETNKAVVIEDPESPGHRHRDHVFFCHGSASDSCG